MQTKGLVSVIALSSVLGVSPAFTDFFTETTPVPYYSSPAPIVGIERNALVPSEMLRHATEEESAISGSVSGVGSQSFTLTAETGTTYTVRVAGASGAIENGDTLEVRGRKAGNLIIAESIEKQSS